MVRYLEGLEPRRGCGYRRVGKLYVRGSGVFAECHRLPIPLTVCPICGSGIKHTRGWIRLNPRKLFGTCTEGIIRCPECGGEMIKAEEFAGKKFRRIWLCDSCKIALERHPELCTCGKNCPVCNPPEKVFMLWVGEKYYPTPSDFISEAMELGVSKAVPSIPKDFELGKSIVFLAHRKAVDMFIENPETLTGYEVKKFPGIFMTFVPTHFEILVRKSDYEANKDKYEEMEKRGIEIIVVPDNYEEMVAKAEEEYKARKSRRKRKLVSEKIKPLNV